MLKTYDKSLDFGGNNIRNIKNKMFVVKVKKIIKLKQRLKSANQDVKN